MKSRPAASEREPAGWLGCTAPPTPPHLQLLALVVELLSVVLQLSDLAVQLAHHGVSLLLQLTASGLLLLEADLPDLDVLLL